LNADSLQLAYLPSPGFVKLRINSYKGAADAEKIDRYFKELESIIPEALYGYEKETLAEVVAKLLVAQDLKIGTVESCTAGLLAHQLTTISGASEYYQGSILSYSNALKSKMAGVDPNLISRHGAVSQEVACAMAEGGRKILEVDICVSTTGIAGPSGGTDEKPVGLVWIAIASKEKTRVKSFQFGDNRERNLTMTVAAALNFLRYEFLSLP
jgi:nicotinamide-nucleotide amidase